LQSIRYWPVPCSRSVRICASFDSGSPFRVGAAGFGGRADFIKRKPRSSSGRGFLLRPHKEGRPRLEGKGGHKFKEMREKDSHRSRPSHQPRPEHTIRSTGARSKLVDNRAPLADGGFHLPCRQSRYARTARITAAMRSAIITMVDQSIAGRLYLIIAVASAARCCCSPEPTAAVVAPLRASARDRAWQALLSACGCRALAAMARQPDGRDRRSQPVREFQVKVT
jgi:hypothetical protein